MRKQPNQQFSILYFLILLISLGTFKTNAQVKTMNLVTDFGAVGDSTTDNTDAFIQAGIFFSNFLTNDTTGVLIIPSFHPINSNNPAVYKVGRQLVMNDSFLVNYIYDGVEKRRKFRHINSSQGVYSGLADSLENYGMLLLNNVHGMVVQGSDSLYPPTIKYKDSLRFGSFMKPGYKFNQYKNCYSSTCITPYVAGSTSEDSSIAPAYGCDSCIANIAFCVCKEGVGAAPDTFAAPPIAINTILNATGDTIPLNWYGSNYDQRTKAWIGQFITIQNSSNVTIKDLIIDGNNKAFKWGGTYSDAGIQLPHDGIFCQNTDSVTIKKVAAIRFGHDGILIHNGSKYISMDNCNFNENTRQGLSWSGGEYVSATNCTFNETGKNNIPSLSNPGAGLDIEPDYPDTCKYGYFYNCEFINNTGQSVVNDFHVSARTYDMHFKKCTMFRKGENGLWCTGQKFLFDSCHIYCSVINSGIGLTDSTATKYIGCDFEDKPYNNVKWIHNYPLFNINGSMNRTLFKDCSFTVNDSLREFCYLNWNFSALPADYTVIDNCTFTYNNKGNTGYTPSLIRNVRFKNENVIRNVNNSVHSYHMIQTRNVMIEGSDTACSPGSLSLSGQVEHFLYSTSLPTVDTFWVGKKIDGSAGYAVYKTDADAFTFAESQTAIVLNRLSAWRNLPKGSQMINGEFVFGGQVTIDAGSYLVTSSGVNHFLSDTGNSTDLLYIDQLANFNQTTTSPIWTTGQGYATGNYFIQPYVGSWLDAVTPNVTPCFQGNHPAQAGYHCSPVYNHIQAQGPFTLLYNLQVPCAGSNANIQFTTVGGKRPFPVAYKLDGVPTDSNLTNIPAGQHTITVTDSSCSIDFIVVMDTTLRYKIVKGCVSAGVSGSAKFTINTCSTPTITGPGTITQSNDTVFVNAAGTYTIVSTNDTIRLYIGDCTNCSNAPDSAEWKAPNLSTTELFPDGIIPLNNIVLQGAIDIDSLLIFNNQRDIYCTHNTQLTLTDSNTFICTRTKMRGCSKYWKGIKADGYGKTVIINNYSTMQDMSEGVYIKNNAFLQARSSTYHNNLIAGIMFENIKEPAYRSAMTGNIFKSDGNMLANNNVVPCAGMSGIFIFNSTDIEIGDSLGKGNLFKDINNGILIAGDINMPTVLNNNTSRIGIYNNQFKDINNCGLTAGYTDPIKINACYGSFLGSAIFADFGVVPSSFDARVDARNANDTNTVIRFENCDKAIVTKNAMVTAKNLYMNNNLMGIMCNGATGKTLKIENNYINNSVIGMQFIGNNTHSTVKNNTIENVHGTATGVNTNTWGTGIDIRHFTNADTSMLEVKENDINVASFAGRGVNMENTGMNVHVMNNNIGLDWDDGDIICVSANLLNGINATNIKRSLMYKNNITGNDSLNEMEREDITGILINNSDHPRIECNIAERTRFGITAISQCPTDTDGIKGNTVHEQVLGWTFRHLGTEGTFWDVGTEDYDNHNLWTGNAQLYKVFKFCDSSQPYKIYTNPSFLEQFESNSFNINTQVLNDCRYLIAPNLAGYSTYICPINFNFQQPFNVTTTGHFAHAEAIAIATHTKTYSEFPEIAYWMDARKLYRDLNNSTTYRHSNDTLLAFYDSLNNAVIEQLEATETNMANLIAAMASQNYDLYIQRLDEAMHSNSNVVSDEDQENNEAAINEIFLKMIESGIDELNSDDSSVIADLANQCPYIGGTAVYKARALYAMYAPANMFDDIAICNAIGVYKGGNNNGNSKGIFDAENEYLKLLKPKDIRGEMKVSNFMIYPNPTNGNVNIKYSLEKNQKGSVIIYDLLGRERMNISLIPEVNHVTVNTNNLGTGVYIYKYVVNYDLVQTGKLLRE